jgi:hypothetical protein
MQASVSVATAEGEPWGTLWVGVSLGDETGFGLGARTDPEQPATTSVERTRVTASMANLDIEVPPLRWAGE